MNDKDFCVHATQAVADYLWTELNLHPMRHDYRVTAATSGPRVFTLSMVMYPKHAAKIMGMAEQLSMVAALDRDKAIRIARGNRGTLALEIPKPNQLWRNVSVRSLPRHRGLKAPVGIDVEHRPALVDFADPLTPHLLAAGTTGSGKTNTARLLVCDLAAQNTPDDVQLILIDARKRGAAWRPFEHLPHLAHPIIIDDEGALRALAWAVAEIGRRSEQQRTRPRFFICIDEAQSILDRPEFVNAIGDIAATGREFGMHLLLATQNPTASQLGDRRVKSNLTTRIVGKVDSGQSAAIATGIPDTGAERLTGPGDMLLVQPSGTRRICTALLSTDDIDDLPAVEEVSHLDLGEYDIDHVLNQSNRGGPPGTENRAAPLDPKQLAVALATGHGITKLAQELRIGSSRAKRLREFADALAEELGVLGYTIIPPDMPSAGVTESDET